MSEKIIFSTPASEYLAKEMAEISWIEKWKIAYEDFADWERELVILDPKRVRNKDVILVWATESDKSHFELIDLLSAFTQDFHARTVHAIIPYLGYSTAERSKTSNIVARWKYRVQTIFDTKPDMVTFLDLHAEWLKNFAWRNPVEHLSSEKLVIETLNEIKKQQELILISPDTGRWTWVKSIARATGLSYEVMTKVRTWIDTVEIARASSVVSWKVAVLFDDMIRTWWTLIKATNSLIDAWASEVFSIATHAVLPWESEQRLQNSALSKIIVTNSHPKSQEIISDKFVINSIARLLNESI